MTMPAVVISGSPSPEEVAAVIALCSAAVRPVAECRIARDGDGDAVLPRWRAMRTATAGYRAPRSWDALRQQTTRMSGNSGS